MNFIDVLAGLNLLLVLGSFLLSVGLIMILKDNEYVLAKGWKYLLPAVLSFSILQVYSFFTEYSLNTPSRFFQEVLLLIFSSMLFWGLLVQYLAVQEAMDARNR